MMGLSTVDISISTVEVEICIFRRVEMLMPSSKFIRLRIQKINLKKTFVQIEGAQNLNQGIKNGLW